MAVHARRGSWREETLREYGLRRPEAGGHRWALRPHAVPGSVQEANGPSGRQDAQTFTSNAAHPVLTRHLKPCHPPPESYRQHSSLRGPRAPKAPHVTTRRRLAYFHRDCAAVASRPPRLTGIPPLQEPRSLEAKNTPGRKGLAEALATRACPCKSENDPRRTRSVSEASSLGHFRFQAFPWESNQPLRGLCHTNKQIFRESFLCEHVTAQETNPVSLH